MNNMPKIVKVSNLIEERLYIDKLYPEFVLISQETRVIEHNGRETTCDVLIGKTNNGIKEFWFDISSFYGKAHTMTTQEYIFGPKKLQKNNIGIWLFAIIILILTIAALSN